MGSFSLWHWLVLVLIVFVPAMVIGLVIWLAVRLSRRGAGRLERQPGGKPMPAEVSEAGDRLRRLQDLKEQGMVSSTEYEMKRSQILDQV